MGNKVVMLGQTVLLMMELRGCEPSPKFCTVLTVQRGMFSVSETDSANGLAKVVSHSDSAESGTYNYMYRDLDGEHVHTKVMHLFTEPGATRVKTYSFILDL